MSNISLEQQLNLIEAQFNAVSLALGGTDPAAVQSNSATLQELAVGLLKMSEGMRANSVEGARLAVRIHALSQGVGLVRENLLRRASLVDRALELVVPGAKKATYADGSTPYANPIRQSGQFKVFSA